MPAKTTIKKSVVLHPLFDELLRKTQALLIEKGFEGTYSSALNLLLLAVSLEGGNEEGFSDDTLKTIQSFLEDSQTIDKLGLQERFSRILTKLGRT